MESNLELPWFALLRYVIGAENSRHFLDQSDLKLKPIAIWSPAFSRFKPFALVYFKLSLAAQYVFPSSDWLM